MSHDQRDIGPVLVALADPTRRMLLDVLAEAGEASATTLAGRLPVSRQAVAKHLQVLCDAGLVAGGRAGREVLFRVRPAPLDASARWLRELSAAWRRRLAAPGALYIPDTPGTPGTSGAPGTPKEGEVGPR